MKLQLIENYLQRGGSAIDSRLISPEMVFFALKGEKTDGHRYLPQVAKLGGRAAVVEASYLGPSYGLELIHVRDVKNTLQRLAKRSLSGEKIIGITGSAGKTTTKEFLGHILEGAYKAWRTPRSYNSQLGLPMALLNRPKNQEVLVLEMGMGSQGDLQRLVELFPPNIAMLTNVALHHAMHFKTLQAIAMEKSAIFGPADFKIANKNTQALLSPISGVEFVDMALLRYKEGKVCFPSMPPLCFPFFASHLCENFVLAASVARHLGMPWEAIEQRARSLKMLEHRFQVIDYKGITFVDDSYNGSAIAMQGAMENLPSPKKRGRKIAVLGDIKELGVHSRAVHQRVGRIALKHLDYVLFYGEGWSVLGEEIKLYFDRDALQQEMMNLAKCGDTVLIKGSNAHRLWEIMP